MVVFRLCNSVPRIVKQVHMRPMSAAMSTDKTVIATDHGDKGVITLNRPKALNAINLDMVRQIYGHLKRWEDTKSAVIIKGVGDKSFCAGGDVRAVVEAGPTEESKAFFREEYTLNALIGNYKIPYIALIDGITMGGGVGLSVHGKYRVATERTMFAMPETQIGLFPDVGGSYFLPRLTGKLGLYLGLTGFRLKGEDVTKAGIATHYCNSDQLDKLEEALLSSSKDEIRQVLDKFNSCSSNEFVLAKDMDQINKHFDKAGVDDIFESLQGEENAWTQKTLQTLRKMSPRSLKVTHQQLLFGATLSLVDCLKMEYRMVVRFLEDSDFKEGVRALLIDKDQNPKWVPPQVEQVTENQVNFYFGPLPAGEELKL